METQTIRQKVINLEGPFKYPDREGVWWNDGAVLPTFVRTVQHVNLDERYRPGGWWFVLDSHRASML